MRIGYVRLSASGPSREAQAEILAKAGVGPEEAVWFEDGPGSGRGRLSGRARAIHSLSPGGELAVAGAGRLGISAEDVLAVLVDVLGRGAAVLDAETGTRLHAGTSAAEALAFAAGAGRAAREERTERLRDGRERMGRKGGAPARRWNVPESRVRELWGDPAVSAEEAAREAGTSVPTLYRRLGARKESRR